MALLLLVLAALLLATEAFVSPQRSPRRSGLQAVVEPPNEGDNNDFPPLDDNVSYNSDIDWDGEWKKVVANQKLDSSSRPGKDFYKSDAEIAAIRAANQATESVARAAAQVPTWKAVQGDWKFWIGILALLSVGTSLLSAGTMSAGDTATLSSPDSYYI